jgi:hypothetical protein
MLKITQSRVSGYRGSHKGDEQRSIDSLYHARSRSGSYTASTHPSRLRPRRTQPRRLCPVQSHFHLVLRAESLRRQPRGNLSHSKAGLPKLFYLDGRQRRSHRKRLEQNQRRCVPFLHWGDSSLLFGHIEKQPWLPDTSTLVSVSPGRCPGSTIHESLTRTSTPIRARMH